MMAILSALVSICLIVGAHCKPKASSATKTMYFIRHSQSLWNSESNPSPDSKLSKEGWNQLLRMQDYIIREPHLKFNELKGLYNNMDCNHSNPLRLASSNLRRANLVTLFAYKGINIYNCQTTLFIDPALQEISYGIDAMSTLFSNSNCNKNELTIHCWSKWLLKRDSWFAKKQITKQSIAYKTAKNSINDISHLILMKRELSSSLVTNPIENFHQFLKSIIDDNANYFIVGGHSHWFQHLMINTNIDYKCLQLNLRERLLDNTEIIKIDVIFDQTKNITDNTDLSQYYIKNCEIMYDPPKIGEDIKDKMFHGIGYIHAPGMNYVVHDFTHRYD